MSVHTDQSHSRAFDGGPNQPLPAEHSGGMYQLKYQKNMDWLRMLPISHCESTPISTKKRQKLRAEGQSMHQDDATKSSEMLPIKHGSRCSRDSGKWQKIRAQLDVPRQTGENSSRRPITRALSQKQELNSHDRAKIVNLDIGTFMGGSCIKIKSEVETLKRCSDPIDVIEIESSVEKSGFHSYGNDLMNDNNDFISRAKVKDEIPDTCENDHGLGSPKISLNREQPMEAEPEKGQSQLIASEHDHECPEAGVIRASSQILPATISKQGNITKDSLEIDHRLGSINRIGLTSGRQSMNPQLEEGQSEFVASQHENECPSGGQWTHSHESNHGLGSSNKIGSNIGAQPTNQQVDGETQSIASQHENDYLKGITSTAAMLRGSSHIMQAIFNKYGDITKACTSQSEFFKTHCFEGICKIVLKLHETHLADMKLDDLKGFHSILEDAESLNFDVKWLHQRLDEIEKAMASRELLKKLEEELGESKVKAEELLKAIEMKGIEQAILKHEIKKLEEQNTIENLRVEELNAHINRVKSTSLSLDYVMHGLL